MTLLAGAATAHAQETPQTRATVARRPATTAVTMRQLPPMDDHPVSIPVPRVPSTALHVLAQAFPGMTLPGDGIQNNAALEKSCPAGFSADIQAGDWSVSGVGDDGAKYTGAGVISRIGGDMYTATLKTGTNTFHGEIFRDGQVLSAAWELSPSGSGVLAFLAAQTSTSGVWFQAGGMKLGKESWTLTGGALAGAHAVSGQNPDGSQYSGTATVTRVADVGQSPLVTLYTVDEKIGSSTIPEIMLGTSNYGTLGFFSPSAGHPADGAVEMIVVCSSKQMSARWVQSIGGKLSGGTEVWTRP